MTKWKGGRRLTLCVLSCRPLRGSQRIGKLHKRQRHNNESFFIYNPWGPHFLCFFEKVFFLLSSGMRWLVELCDGRVRGRDGWGWEPSRSVGSITGNFRINLQMKVIPMPSSMLWVLNCADEEVERVSDCLYNWASRKTRVATDERAKFWKNSKFLLIGCWRRRVWGFQGGGWLNPTVSSALTHKGFCFLQLKLKFSWDSDEEIYKFARKSANKRADKTVPCLERFSRRDGVGISKRKHKILQLRINTSNKMHKTKKIA